MSIAIFRIEQFTQLLDHILFARGVLQLKREVAEVEKELNEIKESNANAEERMQSIFDPWKEMLDRTLVTLTERFSE